MKRLKAPLDFIRVQHEVFAVIIAHERGSMKRSARRNYQIGEYWERSSLE